MNPDDIDGINEAENDFEYETWDDDEDERELARHSRWEPADDEVESMIDFTDSDED